MTIALRLLALVGSLAHAIDRGVSLLLGFLPIRLPGALLVALLLGLAAWGSAEATGRAIAARPSPTRTTVAELVDRSTSAWVSVSGLISGPHLDNGIYASDRDTHFVFIRDDPHDHVDEGGGEPLVEPGRRQTIFALTSGDGVTRWFYVLRDAGAGDRALVVRSARDGDAIRTRSVVAVREGSIDGRPHLVELADAGSDPATGSVEESDDGERLTLRGAFTNGTEVDGGTWRYLVVDAADPDSAAWVDSPHAPDALPVTLDGVVATDASRMEIVLGTDEMATALDGLRHPDDLVLADGIGPVIPEVGYLGAFLLAGVAALLALSAAVRYPVFRPAARRDADGELPRPVVEELIAVDVHGTMPGVSGAERLSGAPARFGWLPGRELARRAWHLRSGLSGAADDGPRLALLAVEGSFVLPMEPVRERLRIEPGLVATSTAVHHALRLSGPGIRVVLGFPSEAERERAHRELEAGTDAPPPAGPIPEQAPPRRPPARPWARPAAAIALGITGILVLGGAALEMLTGEAAAVESGLAIVAAAGLATLALGVARAHPLADELLPSAALLGLVVAGVVALASVGCGTWLTPNVAGCSGFDPIGLVPPLAGVVAFALSLWAMPHLSPRPSS